MVDEPLVGGVVAGAGEGDGQPGLDPARVGLLHEDPVGELDCLLDVVGEREHRSGRETHRFPEAEQLAAEVLGGEHVEGRGRLVHEQVVGPDDQRSGEADRWRIPPDSSLG